MLSTLEISFFKNWFSSYINFYDWRGVKVWQQSATFCCCLKKGGEKNHKIKREKTPLVTPKKEFRTIWAFVMDRIHPVWYYILINHQLVVWREKRIILSCVWWPCNRWDAPSSTRKAPPTFERGSVTGADALCWKTTLYPVPPECLLIWFI